MSALLAVLAGLCLSSGSMPPYALRQLDIELDGPPVPNSDWGVVSFEHGGFPTVMYFNLNVAGRWEVENCVVLSEEGIAAGQSNRFYFDLGTPDGFDVTMLPVGAALTPEPLAGPPPVAGAEPVGVDLFRMKHGGAGGVLLKDKSKGQKGGASDGPKYVHEGFPNQECGEYECVPAAVSNSLQFLKAKHGLPIPDAAITIPNVKTALRFVPQNGTDAWFGWKKVLTQGFPGPKIISNIEAPRRLTTTIESAMKEGCDVEMMIGRAGATNEDHTVALVGYQKLANGLVQVSVKHDRDQKGPGGTDGVDTYTIDPSNTENVVIVDGPPGTVGKPILGFVTECPKIPKPKRGGLRPSPRPLALPAVVGHCGCG